MLNRTKHATGTYVHTHLVGGFIRFVFPRRSHGPARVSSCSGSANPHAGSLRAPIATHWTGRLRLPSGLGGLPSPGPLSILPSCRDPRSAARLATPERRCQRRATGRPAGQSLDVGFVTIDGRGLRGWVQRCPKLGVELGDASFQGQPLSFCSASTQRLVRCTCTTQEMTCFKHQTPAK